MSWSRATRAVSSAVGRPGTRMRRCRKENHAVATGPKIAAAEEKLARGHDIYIYVDGREKRKGAFRFPFLSFLLRSFSF